MHGAGAEVTPLDVWLAVATILLCVALSAFFAASRDGAHRCLQGAHARPGETRRSPRRTGQPVADEPGTADRDDAAWQHARQHRRLGVYDQCPRRHRRRSRSDLRDRPHDRNFTRVRRSHAEDSGDQLSRPYIAAGRARDLFFVAIFRADPRRRRNVRARFAETCRRRYEPPAIRFCQATKS